MYCNICDDMVAVYLWQMEVWFQEPHGTRCMECLLPSPRTTNNQQHEMESNSNKRYATISYSYLSYYFYSQICSRSILSRLLNKELPIHFSGLNGVYYRMVPSYYQIQLILSCLSFRPHPQQSPGFFYVSQAEWSFVGNARWWQLWWVHDTQYGPRNVR